MNGLTKLFKIEFVIFMILFIILVVECLACARQPMMVCISLIFPTLGIWIIDIISIIITMNMLTKRGL